MASREMQKRLKELAAALKAEPGSIPRRLELAAALREASRPADAIDLYRGVAAVYAEEGRLVQAMAVCKGILEIDPEHRDTLEMLATLAQKRAGRGNRAAATEVKQVDGRWVVEPRAGADSVLDQHTPAKMPLDDFSPVSRAELTPTEAPRFGGATRAGDDPEATRVGDENYHDLRGAMAGVTPPHGLPTSLVSGAYEKIDLSEAPTSDTDPQQRAPSGQYETVRMAGLSEEELQAREMIGEAVPEPIGPRDTPVHGFQHVEHVPSEPIRTVAGGELYGPEETTATIIQDAMTAPFPRPELKVEPPPFPLLSELPRSAFLELLTRLELLRLPAGETVVREGDAGDAAYLVAAGSVRVHKGSVEVAVLGPGSFFGEFAVLADQRRHASVTTIEPVELLEIKRHLLDELVSAHPGVARTLRKFYRERLLSTLMATAPFFEKLQPEERAGIAERFRPRRFGRGARIIDEGSPGGGLYLILVGEVEVVRGQGEAEVTLGKLGEGSYFGEMSLLRGGTASATVRAARMTEVVQLPPRDFYEVVSQHPVLWEQLRTEAEKRELANHAIVAGEARKSDDGTVYLV